MDQNPYSTPQSGFTPSYSGTAEAAGQAIEFMRKSKGWVMFIAVLTFIGAVFSAFSAVGSVAALSMGLPRRDADLPPLMDMLVNLVGVAASIVTGILLVKYCGKITQASVEQSEGSLEEALVAQQKYWKFWGIFTIVNLVLMVVALIVVLVPMAM